LSFELKFFKKDSITFFFMTKYYLSDINLPESRSTDVVYNSSFKNNVTELADIVYTCVVAGVITIGCATVCAPIYVGKKVYDLFNRK